METPKEKCETIDFMLDVFGRKWTTRVFLRLLYADRKMGFNELLRATPGVNPKMLADRLKSLEKYGLIKREVQTNPIRTFYYVTEAGKDLKGVTDGMVAWNKKWNFLFQKKQEQPKQF
ncbi:MAG: helix-turn-helix domain-containing protein [Candidatus Micrarchaeia archaeon]